MDKQEFIQEVSRQLSILYGVLKEGYEMPDQDRHRTEGFMRAGVFMGLVTNREMNDLVAQVHEDILGETIEERRKRKEGTLGKERIDYGPYDVPAYVRR